MLTNLSKTPFPYFGGKADAAAMIWAALGDCSHYVEPFAGSLAVLLRRPHVSNRAYYSETVNDCDGLLVNAWRSIQLSPDATAAAASNPVAEADLHARHLALCRWREERDLELLMGDPNWHDPVMGGWWIWGLSCWIGGGWCSGNGAWIAGDDGRFQKRNGAREPGVERTQGREPGVKRQLPHLSTSGSGANSHQAKEPGVKRQVPRLGNGGQGANHPGAREPGVERTQGSEPGVTRGLPHLTGNGRGANHAGAREPGVSRRKPHLVGQGQGVNHPCAREPGVERTQGSEPGVERKLPHLSDNGTGANHHLAREPGIAAAMKENPYHSVTMPEIVRWFQFLSARLRHVRILNGDWARLVTTGATKTLNVRQYPLRVCGIFLDPPYGAEAARDSHLYTHDSETVAEDVAAWCLMHGDDKDYRIALAGYDTEHGALESAGWRVEEWFRSGFLKGGMAQLAKTGTHQQHRERIWFSPHCIRADAQKQRGMFDEEG